jgi:Zn finger protein HypA/HybF involved in hydrogenase expression
MTSVSVSEVLVKLGLRLAGGNHAHVRRRSREYGIKTSHFLGKRANCGTRHRGGRKVRPQELLVCRASHQAAIRTCRVRKALLDLGREYKCEGCDVSGMWQNRPLVLQSDHINGQHHDYRPENLRFLCPNCHSQTANFCVRNHAYAEVAERQTPTA